MPVDYIPFVVPILAILAPLVAALLRRRRLARVLVGLDALALVAVAAMVLTPYARWIGAARRGEPQAEYEIARWYCARPFTGVYWSPDHEASLTWLERASEHGDVRAMYLVGLRYKLGIFVPRPAGWKGPAGNVFPQPERGDLLMNEAVRRGFVAPSGDPESFYWHSFVRGP